MSRIQTAPPPTNAKVQYTAAFGFGTVNSTVSTDASGIATYLAAPGPFSQFAYMASALWMDSPVFNGNIANRVKTVLATATLPQPGTVAGKILTPTGAPAANVSCRIAAKHHPRRIFLPDCNHRRERKLLHQSRAARLYLLPHGTSSGSVQHHRCSQGSADELTDGQRESYAPGRWPRFALPFIRPTDKPIPMYPCGLQAPTNGLFRPH